MKNSGRTSSQRFLQGRTPKENSSHEVMRPRNRKLCHNEFLMFILQGCTSPCEHSALHQRNSYLPADLAALAQLHVPGIAKAAAAASLAGHCRSRRREAFKRHQCRGLCRQNPCEYREGPGVRDVAFKCRAHMLHDFAATGSLALLSGYQAPFAQPATGLQLLTSLNTPCVALKGARPHKDPC